MRDPRLARIVTSAVRRDASAEFDRWERQAAAIKPQWDGMVGVAAGRE